MSAPSALEWRRRWSDLQTRRIAAAVSLPAAALVGWLVAGWMGWLLAVALPLVAFGRLYAWRCPDCRQRFTGAGLAPMPPACAGCGLPAFDWPTGAAGDGQARPGGGPRSLPVRLRRVIAVSQIVGGVLVGLVTLASAWQGAALAWWYAMMLEGIAFAAVLSGVLLWRDHAEGLRLTRILLLLQVVKLYTPWIVYDLRAGFGVLLHASAGGAGIVLDARGMLQLVHGATVQPTVAINVLAVAWLCILFGARAREPAAPRDEALAPSVSHSA